MRTTRHRQNETPESRAPGMNISEAMWMAVVRVRRGQLPPAPTDVGSKTVASLAEAMNDTLALVFSLYVKTRNFQWHVSDSNFDECRTMLEEQGDQLYSMIEPIAERVRALGTSALSSIGHLTHRRIVLDGEASRTQAMNMLIELRDDNKALIASLRQALFVCELQKDGSAVGLLVTWIDEAQRRTLDLHDGYRSRAPAGG
jgi:starvation-inducible DNA-binding protein